MSEGDEKKFWERARPAAEFHRLRNRALGLHYLNYYVRPQPDTLVALPEVFDNWDELLEDMLAFNPLFENEDEAGYSIVLIGEEDDETQRWRSVGMLWEEFADVTEVERLLRLNRPGSDPNAIMVSHVIVEILLRPHAKVRGVEVKNPDAVARARQRERNFEQKGLAARRGRAPAAAPGLGLGFGPGMRFGSFDPARILRARPHQTSEWYAQQSRGRKLHPIDNRNNNLCLEYCFAVYDMERKFQEQRWAKMAAERKIVVDSLDEEVLHAQPDAQSVKRVTDAMRAIKTGAGEITKQAKILYEQVWGQKWTPARDRARGVEDLIHYHNKLKTRIQVFSWSEQGTYARVIYRSWDAEWKGDEVAWNAPLVSLLWTPPPEGEWQGHFDVIPSHLNVAMHYLNLSNQHKFCNICLSVYTKGTSHRCSTLCVACAQWGCPATLPDAHWDPVVCDDCNCSFRGAACFAGHKRPMPSDATRIMQQTVSDARLDVPVPWQIAPLHPRAKTKMHSVCETKIYCPTCCADRGMSVRRFTYSKKYKNDDGTPLKHEHKCGWDLCAHCEDWVHSETHQCFVQKKEWKKAGDPDRYVCIDIETDTRDVQRPYLIRVSVGLGDPNVNNGMVDGYDEKGGAPVCDADHNYNVKGEQVSWWFEGPDCDAQFVKWMLKKREKDQRGFTVLAHNGSGFDFPALYSAIVCMPDMATRRTVKPIYRGTTQIGIVIGRGDNAIHFVDTYLHYGGKLEDGIKNFELAEEMKACDLSGKKVLLPCSKECGVHRIDQCCG
jgi:hypothetical protein